MTKNRLGILTSSLISRFQRSTANQPKSSEVLKQYLRQRNYPSWTAWYVPYSQVQNDYFSRSHFNFDVDGLNYHVLRTGAFPFIKFHCTRKSIDENLKFQDVFYTILKLLNFGFPTLLYGIAGLLWANHTEQVYMQNYHRFITLYFWYPENVESRDSSVLSDRKELSKRPSITSKSNDDGFGSKSSGKDVGE